MASNVIGLFDDKNTADQVVNALLEYGFNQRNISSYVGDKEDLADELEREGISDDDASYYVEKLLGGGALVSVRAKGDHVDEAVAIMNRYSGSDDSEGVTTDDASYVAGDTDTYTMNSVASENSVNAYPTDRAASTVEADDETRLAVAEERLAVGKREVQRGGMRVRSVVTERPVEEQVTLRDETIRVDRQTVNREITEMDGDLFTEQTFEFTETDEEAVVAKEAHVIEEVVIGKDVEQRTETVRDSVRRTEVEVEEVGADASREDYGYTLANDARFQGREWDDAEADIRADWESRNQGRWEDNRESVRQSWDSVRSRS